MNVQQLQAIMPAAKRALLFLEPLNAAMEEFGILAPLHQAMFIPQIAVETNQLGRLDENLNYSADGLANTWPSRYAQKDGAGNYVKVAPAAAVSDLPTRPRNAPNDLAKCLDRNAVAIANNVYANRGGNGDEASGDGWMFRGAGGFMCTFHDGHAQCAAYFGIPLHQVGDWLRTPEGAMRSAGWYWSVNGMAKFADAGDFDGVCDVLNIGRKTQKVGDAIGYAARLTHFNLARKELL